MLLHEQDAGTLLTHGNSVNAVANFGGLLRQIWRFQSAIDRLPGSSTVIGAKRTRRRNRDVHPLRVALVQNDGVQTHPSGPGLPFGSGAVATEAGEFLPGFCAVG